MTETLEPDYRRRATVRGEIEATGFLLERVYAGKISYTLNFKKPDETRPLTATEA